MPNQVIARTISKGPRIRALAPVGRLARDLPVKISYTLCHDFLQVCPEVQLFLDIEDCEGFVIPNIMTRIPTVKRESAGSAGILPMNSGAVVECGVPGI